MSELAPLAAKLSLGSVLETLGTYELVDHWTQGEFHHDVVVRTGDRVLVVATNCNGGVKEILAFDEVPDRWALWAWRCPDNPEFGGEMPEIRDRITTVHWFDPCELLTDDARSELRPEHRVRQRGGGWGSR
jgi:hypothetical protein